MWYIKPTPQENWAWFPCLSQEECDALIHLGNHENQVKATVDDGVDDHVRKSKVSWIRPNDHTKWIYERCASVVADVNSRFFGYDLTYIEDLQFTVYDIDNPYYGKHMDSISNKIYGDQRKLTFSIQLSDDTTYEGGDLILHYQDEPVYLHRKRGTMLFFPSYVLHEVLPVTSGCRYSLVGWVRGPNFK